MFASDMSLRELLSYSRSPMDACVLSKFHDGHTSELGIKDCRWSLALLHPPTI
jgi:hypothetical protein